MVVLYLLFLCFIAFIIFYVFVIGGIKASSKTKDLIMSKQGEPVVEGLKNKVKKPKNSYITVLIRDNVPYTLINNSYYYMWREENTIWIAYIFDSQFNSNVNIKFGKHNYSLANAQYSFSVNCVTEFDYKTATLYVEKNNSSKKIVFDDYLALEIKRLLKKTN